MQPYRTSLARRAHNVSSSQYNLMNRIFVSHIINIVYCGFVVRYVEKAATFDMFVSKVPHLSQDPGKMPYFPSHNTAMATGNNTGILALHVFQNELFSTLHVTMLYYDIPFNNSTYSPNNLKTFLVYNAILTERNKSDFIFGWQFFIIF